MGRPVTVTIPHRLGRAEARVRVNSSVDQFRAQLASAGLGNVQHAWNDDRLNFTAKALGQTINGRLDVNEDNLQIEVELPSLLAGFAEKVAGKLQSQGKLLLEKK